MKCRQDFDENIKTAELGYMQIQITAKHPHRLGMIEKDNQNLFSGVWTLLVQPDCLHDRDRVVLITIVFFLPSGGLSVFGKENLRTELLERKDRKTKMNVIIHYIVHQF